MRDFVKRYNKWGYISIAINIILFGLAVFVPEIMGDKDAPGVSNTRIQSIVVAINYPIVVGLVNMLIPISGEPTLAREVVTWIILVVSLAIYWYILGIVTAYLISKGLRLKERMGTGGIPTQNR